MRIPKGYIYNKKKQVPKYLVFRCVMVNLIYSWKKLCKAFKLLNELLKTEMNPDEVDGDNYKDKKDEWLDYVKQDVLYTAFSYDRYTKTMEKITGFGIRDCLSLPG